MDEQKEHLPWVEKYRPKSFDNIISHSEIIKSVKSMIDKNNIPHLLLHGPAGTGKTSTINVICKYLFGDEKDSHVLELNASDDRNISTVRNEIQNFASTDLIFSNGIKIVILDEADAMTNPAQMALRCIIESNTAHVRFCIICNTIDNIIPAIQSRCAKFRFPPLKNDLIYKYLYNIIEFENLSFDKSGVDSIVKISKGDLRKAINILQSTSLSLTDTNYINEKNVYSTIGYPSENDIRNIFFVLINYKYKSALNKISEWKENNSLSLSDIITEITNILLEFRLPAIIQKNILKNIGDLEYFLSKGTNENLHLKTLVGIFQNARLLMCDETN